MAKMTKIEVFFQFNQKLKVCYKIISLIYAIFYAENRWSI
jgi:hypothetical protein